MQFADVFDHIGHIGLYQVLFYLLAALFPFFNGMHNMSVNFFAAYMDHWCRVPRLGNFSYDTQRYVAIPYSDEGGQQEGAEYDTCSMYDLDYDSLTDQQILAWDRNLTQNASVISCTQGWIFDQSEFVSTIDSKVTI